ncbi:MAG: S41 family peptidase, partial [candidate division Zixibacteria bacterium]|nr:S41 family peptidase [candidate division Zixibacteria bacterium]
EVDSQDLIKSGIEGMLKSLDPYSEYLDEKEYHALLEDTQGQFEGLGIEIAIKDGWLTVIAPLEDTPADRMGIQAGDRIVEIEGVSTQGITAKEAVAKLRGKKGTVVYITIQREGIAKPMEYAIVRDVIEIRAVPYYGITPNKIGYVRLNRFSETSSYELKDAVSELLQKKIKGLILDLRGNPGGLLTQAIEVTGIFLNKDKLVVETKGKVSAQNKKFFSSGKSLCTELPLVVLVDEGSASGSEIVAGAIQDWDRGIIVGAPTFGKGLVQSIMQMKGGGALKLTTAKYYIPSGRCIQKPELSKSLSSYTEKNLPSDSIPQESDSNKEKFLTKSRRVVYGGGGIMPDVEVPSDELSPLEYNLLAKLAFFDFAVHYTATYPKLPKDFEVDQTMLSEFKEFLKTKKFSYQTASDLELEKLKQTIKEEGRLESTSGEGIRSTAQVLADLEKLLKAHKENDLKRSEDYIKWKIKESILVKLYGQSAKYEEVWLNYHPEIKKALQILSDPDGYKSLLSMK